MASVRKQRRDVCIGKKQYAEKETAHWYARKYNQSHEDTIAVYKCRFCHHWHVGHQSKKLKWFIANKGWL